jgi:muconolactone delta-isomerase
MKILAIEKEIEGVTEKDFTKDILKKEAMRAWELYQKGSVREMYFTSETNLAVLILEADNKEEAEKILQTLPLVKEKLIAFDISPLIPYSGFERLFE